MASIRVRKDSGLLFMDFYYNGKRCREQTALPDTVANRKKVQKLLDRLTEEMSLGSFDYARYFPNSKMLATLAVAPGPVNGAAIGDPLAAANEVAKPTPLFSEFSETWYSEKQVEWRHSHCEQIRQTLDRMLLPQFGGQGGRVDHKGRHPRLSCSAAKTPARGKTSPLSNPRINKILAPLRMILDEVADRFDFRSAVPAIKQLKVKKTDVQPSRWKTCSTS